MKIAQPRNDNGEFSFVKADEVELLLISNSMICTEWVEHYHGNDGKEKVLSFSIVLYICRTNGSQTEAQINQEGIACGTLGRRFARCDLVLPNYVIVCCCICCCCCCIFCCCNLRLRSQSSDVMGPTYLAQLRSILSMSSMQCSFRSCISSKRLIRMRQADLASQIDPYFTSKYLCSR